jgi:hypothetical protein
MPTCSQCGRPALYAIGPQQIPLCLEHATAHQQLLDRQLEVLQRQADQALDDMEMVAGVPMRPRRQRPTPVTMVRPTFHNIHINDSTVGVVNQGGNLSIVDAAVTAVGKAGEPDIAKALKTLTEAAMTHAAIEPAQKAEAAEILSMLASEVTKPKPERRAGAARPLLHRLKEILAVSADLVALAEPAFNAMMDGFGL